MIKWKKKSNTVWCIFAKSFVQNYCLRTKFTAHALHMSTSIYAKFVFGFNIKCVLYPFRLRLCVCIAWRMWWRGVVLYSPVKQMIWNWSVLPNFCVMFWQAFFCTRCAMRAALLSSFVWQNIDNLQIDNEKGAWGTTALHGHNTISTSCSHHKNTDTVHLYQYALLCQFATLTAWNENGRHARKNQHTKRNTTFTFLVNEKGNQLYLFARIVYDGRECYSNGAGIFLLNVAIQCDQLYISWKSWIIHVVAGKMKLIAFAFHDILNIMCILPSFRYKLIILLFKGIKEKNMYKS